MIDAGELNKRVTIEYPIETRGGEYSDPQQSWEPLASVWAKVEPLTGREFFQNREQQGELTVRITIRALEAVTDKMRVVWNAKTYQIKSVIDPLEFNEEMQLMCAAFSTDT